VQDPVEVREEGFRPRCELLRREPDGRILFTGDTGDSRWDDRAEPAVEGKVKVLVIRMKTVEYLPKVPRPQPQKWDEPSPKVNPRAWEGTRELAAELKPKRLVIRTLGLCCVGNSPSRAATRPLGSRLR
jgi:hypothetical protein